jgi:hypothetical protein
LKVQVVVNAYVLTTMSKSWLGNTTGGAAALTKFLWDVGLRWRRWRNPQRWLPQNSKKRKETVMAIRAIETTWKGYRFRSRLEARWAVFFTRMGLRWEYEPEGFDIDGISYLPDFRVTTPQGSVCWYEIKPSGVMSDRKFSAFEAALHERRMEQMRNEADEGKPVRAALLSGDPSEHVKPYEVCPRCGFLCKPAYGSDYGGPNGSVLFGCGPCDFETPGGHGHPIERGLFNVQYTPHEGFLIIPLDWMGFFQSIIRGCADEARAARFEHGEVPA